MTARSMVPFIMVPGARAEGVSLAARAAAALFGSPNVRRANGIVSTRFDAAGALRRAAEAFFGRKARVPVFSFDRVGLPCSESLPRIWLSERVSNTRRDDGRRVFVECYPASPDAGGRVALELGDQYLGEGLSPSSSTSAAERKECFRAAEILYLHAVRRGNRVAASRLKAVYENDLCEGEYWTGWIEGRAKHARRRSVA